MIPENSVAVRASRLLCRISAIATMGFASLGTTGLLAQPAFPSKPVRVVVGFPPGGGNDLFIRALTPDWGESLGQQVIVENKPGAAGLIANEFVMRAPADGYTLLLGSSSAFSILPHIQAKLPYHPIKDYTPVGTFARTSHVLVANSSLKANNVKELIALLKEQPGKLSYASAGTGTILHLEMELFLSMTDTKMTHVPYKGADPAMADVAGNHLSLMWASISQALPQIKIGRLKAIAISSIGGSSKYPGVPSLDEAGLKGYDLYNWFAIFAPSGTPGQIVAQLNVSMNKALATQRTVDRLDVAGAVPFPGKPEDLAALVPRELETFGKIVRSIGLAAK